MPLKLIEYVTNVFNSAYNFFDNVLFQEFSMKDELSHFNFCVAKSKFNPEDVLNLQQYLNLMETIQQLYKCGIGL